MTGTGDPARPGNPSARSREQPPEWSLELLADLHADALTGRVAARLRPRVAPDPQARAVLAALDATVADLAALPTRCPTRMPDAVAQRLDAALAVEALAVEIPGADRHPSPRPAPARPQPPHRRAGPREPEIMLAARRRLRARWIGAGVLAAAVAGVAMSGVMTGVMTGEAPRAGDALGAAVVSPPAPLALSGGDISDALNYALEGRDYGPLSRPEALRRCLDANDVPVRDKPLGAREVTLDGRRGVILVLPTTQVAQVRLLVVGSDCGPGNPARMADVVASRR
ncbi:MAG: hypothetical protein ACRDSI_17395 [Pseudonocardiaceae bacterium]